VFKLNCKDGSFNSKIDFKSVSFLVIVLYDYQDVYICIVELHISRL